MEESCIGTFLLILFITVLALLLPCIITLFLHLLSTNHKCTQACYFPLLLKPAAQKERMDWNSSTWSSRLHVAPVFHCSVLLRVVIVFRDTTYVIIILYSWHLVICEHFWLYVWNNWSRVINTMSTWFWHKNRVWQNSICSLRNLSPKSCHCFSSGCDFSDELEVNLTLPVSSPCRSLPPGHYGSEIGGL
jgi:hypothetical protein